MAGAVVESRRITWARWWLWLWGGVAVGLIVLALTPVLSFKEWAAAALVGFGSMEGIGLYKADDRYPPLTQVIRQFVPRWAAFPAIYGITAAAGGVWLHFSQPHRLGLLFALVGWLSTHFDTAFDGRAALEEREKLARVPILRKMLPALREQASNQTQAAAVPTEAPAVTIIEDNKADVDSHSS
jgi:hypothetical protein